ncbi:NAD(+) kinase [Candidatus Berkiella aquae]|uniref:NAD kinase n=1 Tax=Candidatus Berkiella aquae TaxID=295108 RepID=A0A0Q9YM65_9GAMM|nr:NAD(+) kinase [Candidatus Berkiella aquae]MCS5710458.1 NAD(+) kinase [Candidatus Berkiella aquae]
MAPIFSTIGLIGKHANPEVQSTLASLVTFLQAQGIEVLMEASCAQVMSPSLPIKAISREQLGALCDLVIVVGGDGSLLDAARSVVDHDVPVVGVNRGRLGFLTDISPQALTQSLGPILRGEFQEEFRFFLEMQLVREDNIVSTGTALNDVVLYSGDIARMMDFQVIIDDQFVYRQRSDGLITATPTGSTAYALSGGGPILHPSLAAIVMVPMHPHTLSSRPIVVDSNAKIELHIMPDSLLNPRLSCDGQIHFDAKPDDRIVIKRKSKQLRLLHPTDYDYYYTLRSKLGWSA